jgi:hypothetical protein
MSDGVYNTDLMAALILNDVVLHARLVCPVIHTSTHAPTHSPNAVTVYAIDDLRSDLGYRYKGYSNWIG